MSQVLNDPKSKILIVEDDLVDFKMTMLALRKNEIDNEVLRSISGDEALEELRIKPEGVDYLLLLDLNAPKIDGFEFLDQVRRDPTLSETKVLILTTSNNEWDKSRAKELGALAYLIKGRSPREDTANADKIKEFLTMSAP